MSAVWMITAAFIAYSLLMTGLYFRAVDRGEKFERENIDLKEDATAQLDREAAWLNEAEYLRYAFTARNERLHADNRDLRRQLAALMAVAGNKDDSLDAAFRDALRERDAAVQAAQAEEARRIEAERAAAHWQAVARHHPSAFGVEMAHRVLAADSDPTPPHGNVRPIRGGAE